MNYLQKKIWNFVEKRAINKGFKPLDFPENEPERQTIINKYNLVERNLDKDLRFSALPKLAAYLTESPMAAINIISENS